MIPQLMEATWAAFAGQPGVNLEGDHVEFSPGPVLPCVVGVQGQKLSWNSIPSLPASPSAGEALTLFDIPWPIHGDQSRLKFGASNTPTTVRFHGLRPRAGEVDRDADAREQWLIWQLQRYAELAECEVDSGGFVSDLDAKVPGGSRRAWRAVEHYWQIGGEEAAELALIVRVAQDDRFVSALRSIERGPRRMLLRQQEMVKISRIQEMDAATLRAYSQAPGSNAVQKAGSRQELLAVVRRDTVDLVENRILRWVATRLRRMAEAYSKRNARFSGSYRVKRVRQLRQLCISILESPRLTEVIDLPHHIDSPTYCLQFEHRYRLLWSTYRLLRRQERLEDDAWQWQTRLWATSARVIFGAMISGLDGWLEKPESTVFFHREGVGGCWVYGPSTPGPFESRFGRCHVVDLQNVCEVEATREKLPGAAVSSGADWLLVWPESKRIMPLWTGVASGAVSLNSNTLKANELTNRFHELDKRTDWRWGGILLIAEPDQLAQDCEIVQSFDGVVAVQVPMDLHACWEDVKAGFELALEDLHYD